MPAAMIRLAGIELKLASAAGQVNILRGLDLEVAAGETVGITGPSGSGKSTMMMIIAGLERPSAGKVEVGGQDLTALNEDQLARFRRARIGIVFQAFHLIPTMTALENVAVPLEFAGRADAFERAGRRWPPSASTIASPTIPASSPAASSSGWRSPAPSPSSPRCCWPTSPPAISTARPAARSSS